MTTPGEVGRKVRQLDNDMTSVYEILERVEITQQRMAATQLRQGNRLDELAVRLDEVAGQVDGVTNRLDEVMAAQTAQGAVLNRIAALLEQRERDGE